MQIDNLASSKARNMIILAGFLAFTGIVAVNGLSKQVGKTLVSKRVQSAKPAPASNTGFVHSGYSQASDDISGTSVSLDEALQKVGNAAILPDASVVGKPVKVVLDETGYQDTVKWGMGILYDSGIKLWIDPKQENLKELIGMKFAPYTDGRKSSYTESKVAGRQMLVRLGGTQIANDRGGKHRVFPSVMWNMNGVGYNFTTNSDTVSIGDLITELPPSRRHQINKTCWSTAKSDLIWCGDSC